MPTKQQARAHLIDIMHRVADVLPQAMPELKYDRRAEFKAYISRREFKSQSAYELHIWSYMRDFFTGGIDAFGFIDQMAAEIDNQFNRAWNEGAYEVGVLREDMEPEDIEEIDRLVIEEQNYLDGIAGDIEEFTAEPDHTDKEFNQRFKSRAATWANGYERTITAAKLWFGNKEKFIWVEGDTQDKCDTCLALDGIVAWAKEWAQAGIYPQGDMLQCGGFNCRCKLERTDQRRSDNAIARLMEAPRK